MLNPTTTKARSPSTTTTKVFLNVNLMAKVKMSWLLTTIKMLKARHHGPITKAIAHKECRDNILSKAIRWT